MAHGRDEAFGEVSWGADSPAFGRPGGRNAATELDGCQEAGHSAGRHGWQVVRAGRCQSGQSIGEDCARTVRSAKQDRQQLVVAKLGGPKPGELPLVSSVEGSGLPKIG